VDALWLTLLSALLSGISLAVGMIIGTRLTGDIFEKKFNKIIEDSPTAKSLKKLLKKTDKLLEDNKLDELIVKVTKFFEDAGELVSSDEAKNFFKNVTELMKDLGGESEVKLKLPKRKQKKKI